MPVAHADRPLHIPSPEDVNPLLGVVLGDRERGGGLPGAEVGSERLLQFVDAPITLGSREPREFLAELTVRSAGRIESLRSFADIAMRAVGQERAVVLRCHASDLTLALVTVLDPAIDIVAPGDVPAPILVWALASRSGDATARSDVLDLLRALHDGGELEIKDLDSGQPVGTLSAPGAPFDPELERDRLFLSDVATLEEWSGMPLPLPAEISADEVARIQQAATMIRDRRVPLRFTSDISATVAGGEAEADELQLEQDLGVDIFGFDVPLGVGRARFPVTVVDSRPGESGLTHATFRPASPEPVVFHLEPPPERTRGKRTLAIGEAPDELISPDADWMSDEREASDELRSGRGLRFTTEEAFFDWLTSPQATSST